MDSRRKPYWPPARGYIAASSPYASAPKIVTTPETIHAINSQKGELTVREMSAETIKMPEPIIEPATSIVASVSVSALTNSRDDVAVSAPVAVVAVKALPRALGLRGSLPPALRRKLWPPSRFCQGINEMSYAKLPTLVRSSFQKYQPWFAVRFR